MLKKLKKLFLMIILILPICFVFTACGEDNNSNNNNNTNNEQPATPVVNTFNVNIDYNLPVILNGLFENVNDTCNVGSNYVLPSFLNTNLNNYFEGWYYKSTIEKVTSNYVTGTKDETISVYARWKKEIEDTYYTDGLEFEYNNTLNSATVSSYSGNSSVVVLPKTIKHLDVDYNIQSIKDLSFKNSEVKKVIVLGDEISVGENAFLNSTLESFSFDKLKSAGNKAFSGTKIQSVNFSNKLQNLQNNVFEDCKMLKNVDFSAINANFTNKNIPEYTFYKCLNLTDVELNENITSIESSAFANCTSLADISFINPSIESINSEAFANCAKIENIELSNKINSIGNNVFNGASPSSVTLTNLFLGNNQTFASIMGSAALSVETITLSGSDITTIDSEYFSGCASLESFIMCDSITTVGNNAFSKCYKLDSITFSTKLKGESFAANAFYDTAWYNNKTDALIINNSLLIAPLNLSNNLNSSYFAGVTSIAAGAFKNHNKIESVTIPASVTTLGNDAFSGCENLKVVEFLANSELTSIGNNCFYNCSNLNSINLQSCIGLKTIGDNAFENTGNFESFNLPLGIESIGHNTFKNNKIANFVMTNETGEETKYFTNNGVLYENIYGTRGNIDGLGLLAYPIANSATSFSLSCDDFGMDSLIIYESAFFGTNLKYVVINSTIEFYNSQKSMAFNDSSVVIIKNARQAIEFPSNCDWNIYENKEDYQEFDIANESSLVVTIKEEYKNKYTDKSNYKCFIFDNSNYYTLIINSGEILSANKY